MKKISIEHNFGGGWRIEVPSRDMSAIIAEAIQDSDTLLSVIYGINRTRRNFCCHIPIKTKTTRTFEHR